VWDTCTLEGCVSGQWGGSGAPIYNQPQSSTLCISQNILAPQIKKKNSFSRAVYIDLSEELRRWQTREQLLA